MNSAIDAETTLFNACHLKESVSLALLLTVSKKLSIASAYLLTKCVRMRTLIELCLNTSIPLATFSYTEGGNRFMKSLKRFSNDEKNAVGNITKPEYGILLVLLQ
jgi:hypothetical protein